MQRIHLLKQLLLIFALLLMSGCPYESTVPLQTSRLAKIDDALLGRWEFRSHPDDPAGTVVIYPFNTHELLIVCRDEGKDKIDLYRAHITPVGNEKFLNLQEVTPSSKDRRWMFLNYRITDDILHLKVVEDKLFTKTLSSSQALRRFLRKHLYSQELYTSPEGMLLKRIRPQ